MHHLLHYILRSAELLMGVFCIITSIILYPNQEGKIQSLFEDFWVKFDDYKQSTLSFNLMFMQQVARLETRLLDGLFGPRLFSLEAIATSCACSIGSVIVGIAYFGYVMKLEHASASMAVAMAVFGIVCLVVFATSEAGTKKLLFLGGPPVLLVCVLVERVVGLLGVKARFSIADSHMLYFHLKFYFGMAVLLFCSVGCDVIFIIATRHLLRIAGAATRTGSIVLLIAVNLLLAFLLVNPFLIARMIRIGTSETEPHSLFGDILSFAFLVSLTNLFDVVLALAFGALATILLVHRLVWPLLSRTLFRMVDIGTKGRRIILVAVGSAFLRASLFHDGVPELLKDLFKAMGG